MKLQANLAVLVLAASTAAAQMASHAPTAFKGTNPAKATPSAAGKTEPVLQPAPASMPKQKVVARVNGTDLLEADLVGEMNAMFPYAAQHNGQVPKAMEPEIRRGALEMLIFEELLYQEAKRRQMTIAPAVLSRSEAEFRKTFKSDAEFQRFLAGGFNGSRQALRAKIERSLLIERMLRTEVIAKSKLTPAEVKAYYDRNPQLFVHGDIIHIQSISILPPNNSPDVVKEAKRRADDAYKAAKAAKSYREFGLLAEKLSDDDFHVNFGDHKPVDGTKLPPEIVKAVKAMKPGDVSSLIQLGTNYTIVRLVAYTPAGKTPFNQVKAKLATDLQKERTEKVRSSLADKLRKNARIERMQQG